MGKNNMTILLMPIKRSNQMEIKMTGEPNAQRFFEAIATIYSRRNGVQITVSEIRRKDSTEKGKERVFG